MIIKMNTLEKMSYIRKGVKAFEPVRVYIPKHKAEKYKSRIGIVKKVDLVNYHVLLEKKDGFIEEKIFMIGELEVAKKQLRRSGRAFNREREKIMTSLLKDSIKNVVEISKDLLKERERCDFLLKAMGQFFGEDKQIKDKELIAVLKEFRGLA